MEFIGSALDLDIAFDDQSGWLFFSQRFLETVCYAHENLFTFSLRFLRHS